MSSCEGPLGILHKSEAWCAGVPAGNMRAHAPSMVLQEYRKGTI